MDYQEALAYIGEIQANLGSEYSLRDVLELCERAGRPERSIKVIHIAGTNGKGAVGNNIASMLAASGYLVGRYASPTIFDYRERVQKCFSEDGRIVFQSISKEETADSLTSLRKHCEVMKQDGFGQPTAFEIETIMAFQMFEKWNVDFAVVETGLGGRLDATNIVEQPLQCIFTSISRDHAGILGNTLPEIAQEKYGIVKEGTQVISWYQEPLAAMLKEICREKQASLHWVDAQAICRETFSGEAQSFVYQGEKYVISQLGTYQVENAAIAIESLLSLQNAGYNAITLSAIAQGLSQSVWHGRFEILSQSPFLLVDGAHNPDAAKRLRESLELYYPGECFTFIFGVFQDKEYKKVLEELLELTDRVYTVTAPGSRGLDSKKLCREIQEMSAQKKTVSACDSMEEALELALSGDGEKKTVVCGSLSILGWVYDYMDVLK